MSSITEIMTRLSGEQEKFDNKKSKAQATRVRATLLELKKACDICRKSILEEAKAMPVKPRSKKLVALDALTDLANAAFEKSEAEELVSPSGSAEPEVEEVSPVVEEVPVVEEDMEIPPIPVLARRASARPKRARK